MRVAVTNDIISKLKRERNRTGLSPHKLMSRFSEIAPNDLSAQMIRDWIRGAILSAQKSHLHFVFSAYESCSDTPAPTIMVTAKMRKQIADEAKRSDLGAYALLNKQQEIAEGIYAMMIAGLLDGSRKTIREDHFYQILAMYQDEPTRIKVSEEKLEALNLEAERTGIGFYSIMNHLGPTAPPFPNDGVLYNWSIGHIKTIRQDLFEAVMAAYQTLPD